MTSRPDLPWREGACLNDDDRPPPRPRRIDDADIPFDDRPKRHSAPDGHATGVRSIARLVADKNACGDLGNFKRVVLGLPTADTQTLIVRLAVTTDALALWAIHCHLDRRGIPPALRWPANSETPQAEFITWAADVLWFSKRHRDHKPKFKGWQRLMLEEPNTPRWRELAYWQFAGVHGKRSVSHVGAKGLGLADGQRYDLMILQTSAMQADRRQLHAAQFAAIRERLFSHAAEYPDRSGQHKPEAVANRRVALWRTHVLSGHSPTATAANWHRLTGERLSRQAVAKQLAIVSEVLRGGTD